MATLIKPKSNSNTKVNKAFKCFIEGHINRSNFPTYGVSPLSISRSRNSCGIREVDGMMDNFDETLNTIKLNKEEYQDFIKKLSSSFKKAIIKFDAERNNESGAFYTVSLPDGANIDLINTMDKICSFKTDWRRNPNSGNDIKLWIF